MNLAELSKPFDPSVISWKPGAMSKSGDKALALAYADLRAYMNRLDEVCGTNWSVSYSPWGERIICHLTIDGVTRASTGEPDKDSDRNEISGTVAEAQAFKRACAMFGLGRYLYTLPTLWVEWDKEQRQFTAAAKAKLAGVLAQTGKRQEQAAQPKQPEQSDCDKLIAWATNLHHKPDAQPCTDKQYQYLAGLIDNITGKNSHRAVLSLLCGAEISSANVPARKVASALVNGLVEGGADYNESAIACIKAIGAEVLQAAE